ncbi:MAG: ferrous iron transport protein B [Acidobacteria bacterium]|nr:ferrous iron transport protein B [Acidobacteriota bacterium]
MTAEPLAKETGSSTRRLILIGNPNVGKSVLFGAMTGRYVTVANYPGTTVEITTAGATLDGHARDVIDTPGTNGLVPQSEDERVARDILLDSPGADIVQVGDLKSLRRVLLLSLQIGEYGLPFTLCLNMSDEASDQGVHVDADALSRLLGINVVATSALRRWNLDALRNAAIRPKLSSFTANFALPIERGIDRICKLLPETGVAPRGIAIAVLSGDATISGFLRKHLGETEIAQLEQIRDEVQTHVSDPLAYAINRDRLLVVDQIVGQVYSRSAVKLSGIRSWLGAMTMHPLWGVPFLFAVLAFAYWFVGDLGAGTLVDFVENTIFNAYINPWAIKAFDFVTPFPHTHIVEEGVLSSAYELTGVATGLGIVAKFIHDLLVGPYGVITMAITYAIAIVLPVVATFFVFFGMLEDSGYLPRLAVMLNRVFRRMGLNGKAVLPMVLGLGCDTMATLTTRVLETRKEAVIVTLLLALGVPCSAQLGVIMAMLGPLSLLAVAIWLGTIGGTIFIVGWLSSKVVKGAASDFVLEVPPIRAPKVSNILIKVAARTEWYLREAVPLFVVGTLVLYLLDLTGVLVTLQHWLSPLVVGALGLPAEAANSFIIGFLRRDYGAAGLFMMQRDGLLNPIQTVVSLTVITLFIPCVANFLMIVKERGIKVGLGMAGFIVVYSFGIGWAMNSILIALRLNLGG